METKFKERTSGLAASLANASIDAYLNRWYQFNIPAEVGRDMAEGLWSLETTFLGVEYDYPAYVIAPRARSAWIATRKTDFDVDPTIIDLAAKQYLNPETDRTVFEAFHRDYPLSLTGAIPTNILFSDRKVTISPAPDEAYFIQIPCRMGPQAALPATGIANETHALAVVTGAAWEYLMDKEDEAGASREGRAYEYYKERLNVYAYAKPRHRRPARSF